MSLILLDNNFSANTIPNSVGNFAAGNRTCSPGPKHVAFAANWALPSYSSGANILGTQLIIVLTGSSAMGLNISGPVSGAGDSIPTLAAGLCYQFKFAVSQSSPPTTFKIGGTEVCSFYNYVGIAPFFATATGAHVPVMVPSPNANANVEPMTVTLVIRQAGTGANSGKWEVESYVECQSLGNLPVSIGRDMLTLADSTFTIAHLDANLATNSGVNATWASDYTRISSIQISDSFDLDPVALGSSYIEFIANSDRKQGMIANSYCNYGGIDFAILCDQQFDGASNSHDRLLKSTDYGKTWAESLFSGYDMYGTASSTLALFDIDSVAGNVSPAMKITRSPQLTAGSNYNIGSDVTETDISAYSADTGVVFGPFTASSSGTTSSIKVRTSVTGSHIRAALCLYDAANSTHGYVGALASGSSISASQATATADYVDCPIGTTAITSGQQYMVLVFVPTGEGTQAHIGDKLSGTSGATFHYMSSITAGTLTSGTVGWDNAFTLCAYCEVVPSSGYATATVGWTGPGSDMQVTIADSSGINTTIASYSSGYRSLSDLKTQIEAIAGSYWTATILKNDTSPANPNSSHAATGYMFQLQNTAAPIDCNGTDGTIYQNQVPTNIAMGVDPATGVMLVVTQRVQDQYTIWCVGRFYDGTTPYDASHWGAEFIIAGGPLNAGTASTGGDGHVYGDMRACIKLADGRWLLAMEYQNNNVGPQPHIVVITSNFSSGTTPLTPTQIAAGGSIEGYAYNGGTPTWSATPAWTMTNVCDYGTEPSVDQLADGRLIAFIRDSNFFIISIGTINPSTGVITWADPTDASNATKKCVCDGGANSSNGVVRPNLWSGNTPGCVVCDNISGVVYFVTGARTSTTNRNWNSVMQVTQANLQSSAITSNNGILITRSSYGDLVTGFGSYPIFRMNNGFLCGVVTTGFGAGFFRGHLDGEDVTYPAANKVATGEAAYGAPGALNTPSYPTTATSQAAQLATDQAAVLASAVYIATGHSILGQAGSYDPGSSYADAQAADAAILSNATLNADGTDTTISFGASDGTAHTAAVYDAGNTIGDNYRAGADAAIVLASASFIVSGHSILGQAGTYAGSTFNPVGTGSTPVTITVKHNGRKVGNCAVTLYTNQACTTPFTGTGTLVTGTAGATLGKVTFHLDSGTYWAKLRAHGLSFKPNPQRVTVT